MNHSPIFQAVWGHSLIVLVITFYSRRGETPNHQRRGRLIYDNSLNAIKSHAHTRFSLSTRSSSIGIGRFTNEHDSASTVEQNTFRCFLVAKEESIGQQLAKCKDKLLALMIVLVASLLPSPSPCQFGQCSALGRLNSSSLSVVLLRREVIRLIKIWRGKGVRSGGGRKEIWATRVHSETRESRSSFQERERKSENNQKSSVVVTTPTGNRLGVVAEQGSGQKVA